MEQNQEYKDGKPLPGNGKYARFIQHLAAPYGGAHGILTPVVPEGTLPIRQTRRILQREARPTDGEGVVRRHRSRHRDRTGTTQRHNRANEEEAIHEQEPGHRRVPGDSAPRCLQREASDPVRPVGLVQAL